MLAGLGSAQCPNTARALAQTQGSAHWLYFTIKGVCYVCVWFGESAAISGIALLCVVDRQIAE